MEDYINFEQAKALKELGFDWKCETFWDDEGSPQEHKWVIKHYHDYPFATNEEACTILRPSLSQVQKWLRDKKHYFVHVYLYLDDCWVYEIQDVNDIDKYVYEPEPGLWWRSYEEALSAGIDEALELLK